MIFADLFCGIGGCSLGAMDAGWEPVLLADNDAIMRECLPQELRCKFQEVDLECPDKAFWEAVSGTEALLCSPPCQSFSKLRHNNTSPINRSSDSTFADTILKAAVVSQSKFVLVENVPQYLRTQIATELCSKLEELGYVVDVRVLDAANFGVPQRRKRGFIFASRRPINFDRSFPASTVRDAFSNLPTINSSDALHNDRRNHSELVKQRIFAVPKDGGSRHALPKHLQLPCHQRTSGFNDVYSRMYWDRVSPTITTGCVNPSKGRFIHPEENRAITLREAARLQSFSDRLVLPGEALIERNSRLIGNAVPPLMIKNLLGLVR